MPDWLKWVFSALSLIGGGLTLAAPHTIAHGVGIGLIAVGAAAGAPSTGVSKK